MNLDLCITATVRINVIKHFKLLKQRRISRHLVNYANTLDDGQQSLYQLSSHCFPGVVFYAFFLKINLFLNETKKIKHPTKSAAIFALSSIAVYVKLKKVKYMDLYSASSRSASNALPLPIKPCSHYGYIQAACRAYNMSCMQAACRASTPCMQDVNDRLHGVDAGNCTQLSNGGVHI